MSEGIFQTGVPVSFQVSEKITVLFKAVGLVELKCISAINHQLNRWANAQLLRIVESIETSAAMALVSRLNSGARTLSRIGLPYCSRQSAGSWCPLRL